MIFMFILNSVPNLTVLTIIYCSSFPDFANTSWSSMYLTVFILSPHTAIPLVFCKIFSVSFTEQILNSVDDKQHPCVVVHWIHISYISSSSTLTTTFCFFYSSFIVFYPFSLYQYLSKSSIDYTVQLYQKFSPNILSHPIASFVPVPFLNQTGLSPSSTLFSLAPTLWQSLWPITLWQIKLIVI